MYLYLPSLHVIQLILLSLKPILTCLFLAQYSISSTYKVLVYLLLFRMLQRFFFGGRLIFGPDVASLFLSTFLIAGPAIAFCLKIVFTIRNQLRENKNAVPWYPVLIVAIVLTMLVSKPSSSWSHSVLSCTLPIHMLDFCIDLNWKCEFSTCVGRLNYNKNWKRWTKIGNQVE